MAGLSKTTLKYLPPIGNVPAYLALLLPTEIFSRILVKLFIDSNSLSAKRSVCTNRLKSCVKSRIGVLSNLESYTANLINTTQLNAKTHIP